MPLCPQCGKIVARLSNHMRTHTGAQPFICDTCGQGFSMQGNLARHMHTHTGAQPYVCDTCGKGFSQRGNLTRHMRTHTGVQSSPAASTTSSSPPGSPGRDPASRPATPFDAPGFRSPSPFQFMAPGEFLSGQRADTPFSQPGNLSRHTGPQSGDSTFSALSPGSPGRGPASRPATPFDTPGFRSPSPFQFMEPGEFLSGQRPDSPFHRKK